MEAFIISQLRKGGEFPGLNKVACPGLNAKGGLTSTKVAGYLIEVYEDLESAVAALRDITEKIGPYYSITPINIEIGVPFGLAKEEPQAPSVDSGTL